MDYRPRFERHENNDQLPSGSGSQLNELIFNTPVVEQFSRFDNLADCEATIQCLFKIIESVHSDEKMVTFALLYIDGILEEDRTRVEQLVKIQVSAKPSRRMDLVGILLKYLLPKTDRDSDQADLASHILSILIDAVGYAKNRQDATDFLNWIVISGHKILSNYGYTFSVMSLVKTNELAS